MSKKSEARLKQKKAKALLAESRYALQVALQAQDDSARQSSLERARDLANEAKRVSNEARQEVS